MGISVAPSQGEGGRMGEKGGWEGNMGGREVGRQRKRKEDVKGEGSEKDKPKRRLN